MSDDEPLRALFEAGVSAWNRGDLEGYLATYAEDAVYLSGGEIVRGREAIAALYRARFASPEAMGRLAVEELGVEWRAGERAFVLGRWVLTRDGAVSRGVFSVVLRRVGEGWRIAADHSSAAA